MALLTISGEPASRWEEIALVAARLLDFELVTESRLDQWLAEEFAEIVVPARAWKSAALHVLSRLAAERHLLLALNGAVEMFGAELPSLHIHISATPTQRAGNVMLEERLDKPEAKERLRALDAVARRIRRLRFGQPSHRSSDVHDLTIHMARQSVEQAAQIVVASGRACGLAESGLLSQAIADGIQFEARIALARTGLAPARKASTNRPPFGHPSEQMFANLLDFYRIEWAYEPRSFPLQWDKDGNVTEAFTPDFYLPESDLYIELTTMRQSLVTRKNRKVKLLRAIYPHVNIQVFYQKDFQDLVLKYGWKAS
ncbi:MAG: hypothetical protein ABL967_14020 [Bryobacteraceae bacterium]